MRNRLNPYKSLPLLACLFLLLAFGCTGSEQGGNGDPDLPEMVEVDLQVGVSDVSRSLQTKASNDDLKPLDGELIHSLVVFIVNESNIIEKKFLPEDLDESAEKGNLTNWSSGTFTLTSGTKQIYAFANWESLENALSTVIATAEGQSMPTLPETVAYPTAGFDPANRKYLPMSVSTTWTVSSSGKKSIELVRLVSRLQVKVTNATTHNVQLDKLDIGVKQQGTMSLFEGRSIEVSTSLAALSFLLTTDTKILKAMTDGNPTEYESGWVYVFESNTGNEGYLIDFETTSTGEGMNHGQNFHRGKRHTLNKEIPRNHVWNLSLWISGYQLKLTLTGENPPIGGYPEVTTSPEGTEFTVYGGGPFTIKIGDLTSNESTKVPEITEWRILNDFSGSSDLLVGDTNVEKLKVTGKTITGRMVGAAKKDAASVTFKLEAISKGQTVSIFPITLKFADIFDQTQSQSPQP